MTNDTLQPRLTEDHLPQGIAFEMIFVQGGKFSMGSGDEDPDAFEREKPVHQVFLDSFYIGRFPVIQSVWKAVMGKNPSGYKGDRRPVENVSWDDAQEFISKLNRQTNKRYRLPTETEWEYAARGGANTWGEGYLYAGSDKVKEVGWYDENSDSGTREVGLKYPNQLGLYDMSGNVYEWCHDRFDSEHYQKCAEQEVVVNPKGPEMGKSRVIRGGSWFGASRGCRATYRGNYSPGYRFAGLGFRLALSLQSVG